MVNVWDWNSPIALAAFAVGLALTLALLGWTLKTLASIDAPKNRRR